MNLRTISLAILLATALPARAGLFDDTEARQRIEQIRQELDVRLKRVETTAETTSRAQLTLNNQIETLKQEIAQLRGQLEQLANDQDQTQKRQKDFYVDLDNRLRKIESQGNGTAPNAQASGPAQGRNDAAVDPAQETRDYETAINLLKNNKHVDAAFAFKQFIKAWPKSALMPGAHFWLATALTRARDQEGAKESYNRVYTIWPEDSLAPDALLGEATATQELGDAKGARALLDKLVAKYPASEAAKTAKQRLGPAKKK